jgi:hypothetical protein
MHFMSYSICKSRVCPHEGSFIVCTYSNQSNTEPSRMFTCYATSAQYMVHMQSVLRRLQSTVVYYRHAP